MRGKQNKPILYAVIPSRVAMFIFRAQFEGNFSNELSFSLHSKAEKSLPEEMGAVNVGGRGGESIYIVKAEGI